MAQHRTGPQSTEAVAERLRLLRRVLGVTTTEMCRRIGSPSTGSAWSNYEVGRRRISLEHALRLTELGVTLSWIFKGVVEEKMEKSLKRRIQDVPPPANPSVVPPTSRTRARG